MRKKTETAIKVLNGKIEKMEKELQNQRKVIEFLSVHDRNDIELFVPNDKGIRLLGGYVSAKYIHNGDLKEANICSTYWTENEHKELILANVNKASVIDITEEKFVVKVENIENLFEPKYYRVTKQNNEITLVSEYYQEPPTVANPDTPTETDFKYFTAEQVRNMSEKEVKENYSDIMKSMKKW
jgi:hypothetical protein